MPFAAKAAQGKLLVPSLAFLSLLAAGVAHATTYQTTTMLTVSTPVYPMGTVTMQASVNPSNHPAGGTVSFYANGTLLCSKGWTVNPATCMAPGNLHAGTYSFTAAYSGYSFAGNVFSASTSAPVSVTIPKYSTTLQWSTPAPILYGTALSGQQLKATANTDGAFTYTPALGTVLPIGASTLSVTFTPTNTLDYETATASVSINVLSLIYSYSVPTGGFDGAGNLHQYTDSVNGSWTLAYDSLNRLAFATGTGGGAFKGEYYCWSYDAFGNRTDQQTADGAGFTNAAGGPCQMGAGATLVSNQWALYTVDGTPGTGDNLKNQVTGTPLAIDQYDAAGNIVQDASNQYLYNADGQICAVKDLGNGAMTGYVYDAEGRRVAKGTITTWGSCDTTQNGFVANSSGTTIYYLGPGGEQLSEFDGAGAWKHTNVYAAGSLIATYDPQGLHYHLTGPLGSRRVQTNAQGAVEQTFVNLPYGEMPAGQPLGASEHHFTGKERDPESGLDYFGARYYGSSMGRWMSPDLVNVTEERMMNPSSTLNKYAYAANNPLKYIDPDGEDITIFMENGVPGHIMMMAYDPNSSSAAVRSFGPAGNWAFPHLGAIATTFGLPVPGTTRFDFGRLTSADEIRKHYESITIKTSPEVTQQVVQALNTHSGDKTYTALGYACASSCARILRQIKQFSGVGTKDALPPYDFFNEMYQRYGNGKAASPWGDTTTNNFKPGNNYGAYQPGWDPFDVLNSFINPSTQTPQRNCTINVNSDGTETGDC